MFTSRAEHRLLFNHGSAELRLQHYSKEFKLLDNNRLRKIEAKAEAIRSCETLLEKGKTVGGTWADRIRRAGERTTEADLPADFLAQPKEVREEALYRVRYRGYLEREERQIEKLKAVEKIHLPDSIDYLKIPGLRRESALKLQQFRPTNLGQAGRISGVNPADLSVLMVLLAAEKKG